jgi:hypothetical protein
MTTKKNNTTEWLFEITPKQVLFAEPQGVWQYRDLLMLFCEEMW